MIERQFETLLFAGNNPAPARDDEIMRPVPALERDEIADQTLCIKVELHQLMGSFSGTFVADEGTIVRIDDAIGLADAVRGHW